MRTAWLVIIAIVTVGTIALLAKTSLANAQQPSSPSQTQSIYQPDQYAPQLNPDVPLTLHIYTQSVVLELLGSVTCLLAGVNPLDSQGRCLGYDAKTGKLGYQDSNLGAIGSVSNMIGSTYNIPVSTGDYATYLAQDFGIVKKVSAQGIGFRGLRPLLHAWSVFRDLAYLVIVLVVVLVGLGIMFRIQIDPRTVMSIQNQIPKVVITLVLITLSYAIAGFLIDLMWISTYIVIGAFTRIDPSIGTLVSEVSGKGTLDFANDALGSPGPWGVFSIISGSSDAVRAFFTSLFDNTGAGFTVGGLITGVIAGLTGAAICNFVVPIAGAIVCGVAAGSLGTAAGSVVGPQIVGLAAFFLSFVIILIAVLYALFRLWFTLLKAYIFLIISIIFSPFWMLAGLLPGSSIGFGAWLRDIVGHLAAFPTAIVLFLIGKVLMNSVSNSDSGMFVPPLIGNPGSAANIQALVGLAAILITPEVVNMVRETIKAPDFKYAAAVGRALGEASGFIAGAPRRAGGVMIASQEMIVGKSGKYEQRKLGRALLGTLFGR